MQGLFTGPPFQILGVAPAFEMFRTVYGLLFAELERQGHHCRFRTEAELTEGDLGDVRVLILYRCIAGQTLSLVPLARRRKIKVIYELDDDLLEPPEEEPWGRHYLIRGIPQIIRAFLAEVDLVKAGSPELARRLGCRGFPAVYRPYAAKLRRRRSLRAQTSPVIGYFGTPHHGPDIEAILPALVEIERTYPREVGFEFIGCAPTGWQTLKRVTVLPYIRNFPQFMVELARRGWTVGLAPLRDTPFNAAKSDSKFRDFSAAGIVGIYADAPPYRISVQHGVNGWLCSPGVSDWVSGIRTALDDPGRRIKGRTARRQLLVGNSLKRVAWGYLELLNVR